MADRIGNTLAAHLAEAWCDTPIPVLARRLPPTDSPTHIEAQKTINPPLSTTCGNAKPRSNFVITNANYSPISETTAAAAAVMASLSNIAVKQQSPTSPGMQQGVASNHPPPLMHAMNTTTTSLPSILLILLTLCTLYLTVQDLYHFEGQMLTFKELLDAMD
jgi:hypothetical protein